MISNHHRLILLEFLSRYKLNSLEQMTLIILNKKYPNSIAELLYQSNNIYVYHIKGTRVFSKEYAKDIINNSITDMIVSMGIQIELSYNDFTYPINDPYYLKDIRQQSFSKLVIIPLVNQENLIDAYALFYLKDEAEAILIEQKHLLKLLNDLIEDEIKMTEYHFLKEINTTLWHIEKDNKNIFSKAFFDKFLTEEEVKQSIGNLSLIKTIESNGLLVKLYHEKQLEAAPKYSFLGIGELSNERIDENSTVIFFQARNKDDMSIIDHYQIIKKQLDKFTDVISNGLYQINLDALAIVLNERIHQKRLISLKQQLKAYRIVYLRPNKEFTLKMDLKTIINYLYNYQEIEIFNANDYLIERIQMEKQKLLIKDIVDDNYQVEEKKIINSITKNILGTYWNSFDFKNDQYFQFIHQMQLINYLLKKNTVFPFIKIDAKTFIKRELWTSLKKLSTLYKEKIGIIITNGNIDNNSLLKYFNKLINLGYYIIIDHEIFSNLEKSVLLNYFGGIFINNKIINESCNIDLCKQIIHYYLNQQKLILIESSNDPSYLHELIYYLA